MVFLGVLQLRQQHVAAHVVTLLLAQLHAGGEVVANGVFGVQVLAQHLLHGLAGLGGMRAHVRVAAQEQDPAQQRVGMLGLFLHLVVQAFVQREQALVLVAAGVDEVLVAGGEFAAQQFLQAGDDVRVAFHGGSSCESMAPMVPHLEIR
ncbi:hypothetical protein D3C73_1048590 [compost metagenome]